MLACLEEFGERGEAGRDRGVGGNDKPVHAFRAQSLFGDRTNGNESRSRTQITETLGAKHFREVMHGGWAEKEDGVPGAFRKGLLHALGIRIGRNGLVGDESPDFRALWRAKPAVAAATKVFLHPRVGRLVFDVEGVAIESEPEIRARFYVPRPRDGTRGRFAKLLRLYRLDARNDQRRAHQEAVGKVRDHLNACYARDVPLDELAALAGMDKFRLLRVFSAEVGFPPHAYQLLVRVHHARRLLSAGDSAAQVAVAVGFSDQSHLIRQFRRFEGMTPAAYLRRQRA